MRILLVQPLAYLLSAGGAHKANRLLIEGFAERGHACRVVAPMGVGKEPEVRAKFLAQLAAEGCRISAVAANIVVFHHNGVEVHAVKDGLSLGSRMIHQMLEFLPTWTIVSEDRTLVLLGAALETSASRVIYLSHSQATLPFGPDSFFQDAAKTKLLGQTAGILTVSNFVKNYILRWGGLESVVIPFPVYGAPPFPNFGNFDKGFVLMINPSAIKGISIFQKLAQELPHVQFAAVPTWATTNENKATLECLPNMRLLEPCDDIDKIFAQTKILLAPSLWGEAFGQIVVEAMLRGIPVVASNQGGLPEAKLGLDYVLPVNPIKQYEKRFDELQIPVPVVPEQNLGPWLEALRKLTSNRGHYELLSRKSREAALNFVSSLSVKPFETYLEDLALKKPTDIPTAPQPMDPEWEASDLRSLISKLSPEKHALLALRAGKRVKPATGDQASSKITRREPKERVPLSFGQQRLWFLEQLDPGSTALNVAAAYWISGPLNEEALRQSIEEIIRRHEILRTSFGSEDGQPFQVVHASGAFALEVSELGEVLAEKRRARALELAGAEVKRPFNLTSGPLLRGRLWRVSGREHLLLLCMHHIITDGWSTGLLVKELSALYQAYSVGRASPLGEPELQYGDYAVWQREQQGGRGWQRELEYWKQQLKTAPGLLEMPTDRPRSGERSFRGGHHEVQVSGEVSAGMKRLSQQQGVTLFMAVVAAFKVLLWRWSGAEQVAVGTPIAGRTRAEMEQLVGFFVNTLVLVTEVRGAESFVQLLEREREVCVGAYSHQEVPFEKLVEELKVERDLRHTPLFQVMVVLQNAPLGGLELAGLKVEHVEVGGPATAKFDLTLFLEETQQGLSGSLEYSTDLFDRSTIARVVNCFKLILDIVSTRPEVKISTLVEMLAQAEKQESKVQEEDLAHTSLRKLKRVRRERLVAFEKV